MFSPVTISFYILKSSMNYKIKGLKIILTFCSAASVENPSGEAIFAFICNFRIGTMLTSEAYVHTVLTVHFQKALKGINDM